MGDKERNAAKSEKMERDEGGVGKFWSRKGRVTHDAIYERASNRMCVCLCVCVCARARVCVCVCVWHALIKQDWLHKKVLPRPRGYARQFSDLATATAMSIVAALAQLLGIRAY